MPHVRQPRFDSGASYFFEGFKLAFTPGIRRFVIIPFIVNLILMGSLLGFILFNLRDWVDSWLTMVPSWLDWLMYVIWPVIAVSSLVFLSYFFSTVANWIAAPFNGLLAEHLESILTGRTPPDEGLVDNLKDLPRVFHREWQKLTYYLPKALGLLLLMLVPVLGQTLIPLLWFIFNGWMMSIQYCDYAFDNHRVPFATMKQSLQANRGQSFRFGLTVSIFNLIPIVNLLVMPAAVCGATALWVDKYRAQHARY